MRAAINANIEIIGAIRQAIMKRMAATLVALVTGLECGNDDLMLRLALGALTASGLFRESRAQIFENTPGDESCCANTRRIN